MRTTLILATLFVAMGIHGQQEPPWPALKHRTAWIFLADLDLETEQWASQPKHEFHDSKRRPTLIPEPGDVLRVTSPAQLVIINYAHEGELNRLASPVGRALTKDDIVGVLPRGTAIEVRELCRERVMQGMQGIWARVVPAR